MEKEEGKVGIDLHVLSVVLSDLHELFCPSQNPFANPGLYTEKPGGRKTYMYHGQNIQCSLPYITC